MSSSGNSNTPFTWFEANVLKAKQLPKPPAAESDRWETVDFPDMVAVAAIPEAAAVNDDAIPIATSPNDTGDTPLARPTAATPLATPAMAAQPIGPIASATAIDDALEPVASSRPETQPHLAPFAPLVGDSISMTLDPVIAATPSTEPVTELVTEPSDQLTWVDAPTDLVQENAQLRRQLAELDAALTRSQTVLRSETERWQAKTLAQSAQEAHRFQEQVAQVGQQNQTLAETQAKIGEQAQELQALQAQSMLQTQELLTAEQQVAHLTSDLEQTVQTAQRQQILVETLTVQLNASQEQVAQLERECSQHQQRYAEQVQLALQAESACRDLRSRLNRQQRYTLQFKAALEKCLEVPAAQGFAHLALSQHPDSDLVGADTAPVPLFIPKASPVQPWSAQPGFLLALQSPLEDSADWNTDATDVVSDAVSEMTNEPEVSPPLSLTDRIAPRITTHRTIGTIELPSMLTADPLGSEPEAELTDAAWAVGAQPDTISELIAPQEAEAENLVENLAEIDLWAADSPATAHPLTVSDHDWSGVAIGSDFLPPDSALNLVLDTALETAPTPTEEAPALAELVDENHWIHRFKQFTELTETDAETPAVAPAAIITTEPDGLADAEVDALVDAPASLSSDLTLAVKSSTEKSIHSAQRLSPFITLADQPALAEATAAEPAPLFYAHGPSPLIYPLRPVKKITSLAAVQLPSFL